MREEDVVKALQDAGKEEEAKAFAERRGLEYAPRQNMAEEERSGTTAPIGEEEEEASEGPEASEGEEEGTGAEG